MTKQKYDNIIELFQVVCEAYAACELCYQSVTDDDEYHMLSYRPMRTGTRLLIPLCEMCKPETALKAKQIVQDYIGPENSMGYGLK